MTTIVEALDREGLRALLVSVEGRAQASAERADEAQREAAAAFGAGQADVIATCWQERDHALRVRATLLEEAERIRAELLTRVQPDVDRWQAAAVAIVAAHRQAVDAKNARVRRLLAELDQELDDAPKGWRAHTDRLHQHLQTWPVVAGQIAPVFVEPPCLDTTVPPVEAEAWLGRLRTLLDDFAALPGVVEMAARR